MAPAASAERGKLLLILADRALRGELEGIFADFDLQCAEPGEQVLEFVRRTEPEVVLFDLGSSREPAHAALKLDLLASILSVAPSTKVIAMTDSDARELAVQAVGCGAADFYHKPIIAQVLSIVVRRAFRIRALEAVGVCAGIPVRWRSRASSASAMP